jgi:hypothetical protein
VSVSRIVAAFIAFGLLAVACADTTVTASTTADGVADGESTDDAPTLPSGSCDADAAFAAGSTASACAPLDPLADAAEFGVPQIASTDREDVPSALADARNDAFPEPLIDLDRVLSGGPPPDGIPPIDNPIFQTAAAVDWLAPAEAVLALEIEGEARAYPIQVMTWHELVNDTIGDVPVTVSYCPLCNSALAYDRRVDDRILDFGTSGRLFNSSLVMYDRQTESLWTHFDATAVAGTLTGTHLTTYPISTVSWEDFRTAYPEGLVLTRNTGHNRGYGRNPYSGYDDPSTRPFLYDGDYDPRLDPKTRVVVVRDPDQPAVALPLTDLLSAGVLEFDAHGRSLIAILDTGTASPLDRAGLADGYDQGAVGVFVDTLDGADVSLTRVDGGFLDAVSGLTFDVFGRALADSGTDVSGIELEPVEHLDTFWFAIAAFDSDVEIVGG